MASIKTVVMGSIPVITDIVSANVLAQVLLLTTQQDLIVAMAIECFILMQYLDMVLTEVFAKNNTLSDSVEHVILRFIYVVRIAFTFVLVRIGMAIVTELFETSQVRWHEVVNIVVLTFAFVFIIVERNTTTTTDNTPASPTPKKET